TPDWSKEHAEKSNPRYRNRTIRGYTRPLAGASQKHVPGTHPLVSFEEDAEIPVRVRVDLQQAFGARIGAVIGSETHQNGVADERVAAMHGSERRIHRSKAGGRLAAHHGLKLVAIAVRGPLAIVDTHPRIVDPDVGPMDEDRFTLGARHLAGAVDVAAV